MKNYLEHEIEVKYKDYILSNNGNWQWFFEYIQNNFNLDDINTWEEFENLWRKLNNVYLYIHGIENINFKNIHIKSATLKDLINISQNVKKHNITNEIGSNLLTNFGKLLFLIIWITELKNKDNNFKYLYDMSLLYKENLFEIYNLNSLCEKKDKFLKYINNLKISGFEAPKKVFQNNLDRKLIPADLSVFNENREKILNYEIFDCEQLNISKYNTWQNIYLNEMLKVSIKDNSILPLFQSGNSTSPNIYEWTLEILEKMENYYGDQEVSSFIIETIKLIKYGYIPSMNTISKYFKLTNEYLDNTIENKVRLDKSVFEIILVILDKKPYELFKEKFYKEFMGKIHNIRNIKLLEYLVKKNFSLINEQKNTLSSFKENQFKQIQDIKENYHFEEYLKNPNVATYIDDFYFCEVEKIFFNFIEKNKDADLFYYYMIFLFKILNKNKLLNKGYMNHKIIRLQDIWEKEYYEKASDNLTTHSTEFSIDNNLINSFNDKILDNPYYFAKYCMLGNKNDLIASMEEISQNPLFAMCTKFYIGEKFPYFPKNNFSSRGREYDEILNKLVQEVKEEVGYKFMNLLDNNIYINYFYRKSIEQINLYTAIFHKEKEVYKKIQNLILDYSFLELSKDIKIGHITQLFPLLEIKIRELAKIYNIVPFKCQEENFIEFKDPSSIFKIMFEKVYEETKDLCNICDLLFVYNCMYNKNSLNIRNKCIHGFSYYQTSELSFVFKITLLSLYMIVYRIEFLKKNK